MKYGTVCMNAIGIASGKDHGIRLRNRLPISATCIELFIWRMNFREKDIITSPNNKQLVMQSI